MDPLAVARYEHHEIKSTEDWGSQEKMDTRHAHTRPAGTVPQGNVGGAGVMTSSTGQTWGVGREIKYCSKVQK